MKIHVPKEVIKTFTDIASVNYGEDGGLVETLCFLMGFEDENNNLHVTDLLLPSQSCAAYQVSDTGKATLYLSLLHIFKIVLFFRNLWN